MAFKIFGAILTKRLEKYVNKEWEKEYPPINFIVLKRTFTCSDSQEVKTNP